MKVLTSMTVWNDAMGKRVSITYSEIEETTGKILKDNVRLDRVLVDKEALSACAILTEAAQGLVDAEE